MIKCNLAVVMAERKMSIQDVANKTGLSRATISALVNEDGKGIQFETMDVLCELFNINPGDLFACRFGGENQLTENRVREIVKEEIKAAMGKHGDLNPNKVVDAAILAFRSELEKGISQHRSPFVTLTDRFEGLT